MSQIKNLIFDLDGTIIASQKEDYLVYKEPLKKLGYNEDDCLKIYMTIDDYEKSFTDEKNIYDKKDMMNFINQRLNKNYSFELIEELILAGRNWMKEVIISKNIIEELSEKYNLYIYTNYFYECQNGRIEGIGYSKYFKKIFSSDIYGTKPFKSSFERVLKELKTKADKCIMIGDTKAIDIAAADNVGMKSILYDYNGKRDKKEIIANNYTVIKNMEELIKTIYKIDCK